ncbi:MAG TPA: LCCL domain-containing protein [Pyrinomonadaceae bacterium]|nr:LCCL domain-containing protein [Pyrinomonadaceae bacterium]
MTPSYRSTQATQEPQCQRPLFRLEQQITRGRVVLLLAAIVLGSAGCSKLRNENTGGGGHTNTSPDNSNTGPSSAPASSPGQGTPTTWEANATSLNGKDGQTFTLACSLGGTAHPVWGSDIYTADSSVCTAAVHSGLITYQQGGAVTIELRPGKNIYGCSERNGVTTSSYGSYGQSFVFKTPNTEAVVREAEDQTPVMWNTSAGMVSFEPGKTLKFKCPSGGKESAVWGTDIYTADSSICNAAVHAGKLTMASGGSVMIELRPGESSYKGSARNGIKTNDYGAYGQSFVVK